MKQYIFSFLVVLFPLSLVAQFGTQQVISTEGDGPQSVFAADLDGDSYKDVLSANKFDSSITWYKNMGDGTFGNQQIIASINQTINLYAADLDGDNDVDVLAVSGPENWVVWYENLDGLGTFGAQQIIAEDAILASTVISADIDGDLDLDVISGSDSSGIAWYENLDGLGTFSSKKVINASASNSRSVRAIDIDGDNDLDIVGSSSGSVTVSWYENLDGLGTFGAQQVIAGSALTVQSLYVADLDGDLDNDVITATNAADKVAWYENLDGLGNFGPEQIITTQADFARSVYASDLDNDNDIDVLSASSSDNKIAWYENTDGLGSFSSQQVITTNADSAHSVFATDLDNDGDMDVLSASQNDDKIAWYENYTILGVEESLALKIKIHPNPANTLITITNTSNYTINSLEIRDIQGKLVNQVEENKTQLDVSNVQSGLYLITITTGQERIVKKIIKE